MSLAICFLIRQVLIHINICLQNLVGVLLFIRITRLVIAILQNASRVLKEQIVKLNNLSITSPVGVQHMLFNILRCDIHIHLLFQQTPVRVPETIYALFYITHNKVEVARCETLIHQRFEIIPLHL